MPIFIETDNSDRNNKIYIATLAQKDADKAEAAIQRAVRAVIGKSNDFTSTKPTDAKELKALKGYVIIIKLVGVTPDGTDLKCSLEGIVVHYPRELTKSKKEGEKMVTTKFTGGAKANTRDAVVDAVEAATESMTKIALPRIKIYDDGLNAPTTP
jgi:hypothetical protein